VKPPVSYRIREVAERANVPESFARRLVAAGALPDEEEGLGPREVRRARLLYSWAAAGLSVESIVELVDRGALSLMFLDAPVMATPERLDRSYARLAADRGVPLALLRAVHQALGFAPPEPGDRAGEDDVTMLEVTDLFRGAGVGDDATWSTGVIASTSGPSTPSTTSRRRSRARGWRSGCHGRRRSALST
jgi:hypothetical protein